MSKNSWVVIIGGGLIGLGLGVMGITFNMPLWWFLNLPLIMLLNQFSGEIGDFFSDWYNDIIKGEVVNIIIPREENKEKRKEHAKSKKKYI